MDFDFTKCACFGVAGNFTGHLEQAGEASDFKSVVTKEENAPKALFPTFIPESSESSGASSDVTPAFLHVFPFSSDTIDFPDGEKKVQIEPECGVIFKAEWKDGKVQSLKPLYFGASNDCSIRKEGAKKISIKKNWGKNSKGFSDNMIPLKSFDDESLLSKYRIGSFLVRGKKAFPYGEDSAVKSYSYIWKKLTDWIIEKLNGQKDEGPAENVNQYLKEAGLPENIFVSIGATRYTNYGQGNFLKDGDKSVVILYPEGKYSKEDINEIALGKLDPEFDVSVLRQSVVLK